MPMLPLIICIGIGCFWNMYLLGAYINPGIAFMVYFILFAVSFRPLPNIVGWIAIIIFQIIVSIFLHSNSDLGALAIVFEVILYIALTLNLFIAFSVFKEHNTRIKSIKNFIVDSTFKLISINHSTGSIAENVNEVSINSTIITFYNEKQGTCTDFYAIKKFRYKIDTRVLNRKTPQIRFQDEESGKNIKLDYQIDTGEEKLRLGEEYAFNDDFRGYTDGDGNFVLLSELIYTFQKNKIF
jgi:hypothetical protein